MERINTSKEIEPQNKQKKDIRKKIGKIGTTILVGSLATSTGLPTPASAETSGDDNRPRIEQMDQVVDSATALQRTIEQKGLEPLSFDEAREMVPHVAGVLTENIDLGVTKDELDSDTFILRVNITEEDLAFVNKQFSAAKKGGPISEEPPPLFHSIQQDYPDVVLGEDIHELSLYLILNAQRSLAIQDAYHEHREKRDLDIDKNLFGVTTDIDDNVFMFLTSTNNPRTVQFYNFNSDRCDVDASPAAVFATVTAHEYFHKAQTTKGVHKDAHPEVLANVGKLLESEDNVDRARVTGFSITTYAGDENNAEKENLSGLDEFVVHYLATKTLTENGIPVVTINNNTLRSSRNFQKIMEQSGISEQELIDLHNNSQLNEFFERVAEGSGKDEGKMNRNEKIKFGFDLFTPLLKNDKDWEKTFTNYFNVDVSYNEDEHISNEQLLGCGVPLTSNSAFDSVDS